jgi:alpha-1,3/alpha-1,6-mannosyltransferase
VFSVALFSSELKTLAPDVIFVDQLSICIPLFRFLYPKAKVLFYGHYPDRLLVKQEPGFAGRVKQVYRVPFDALEGWSTGCADSVVVNSKYTRSVFKQTFKGFQNLRKRELKVVYPCVDTKHVGRDKEATELWPGKKVLLSINRFEGKKNLALAIKAYAGLSKEERSRAKLVLAGGYDPMNHENAATHKDLQALAESLDLSHATFKPKDTAVTDMSSDDVDILFLLSIPQTLKQRLLQSASLLIYTPTNEHFGIVPLEAMLAGIPVLATNTGGPLETIYDGRTGWLRDPSKISLWTDVMRKPLIPSSASTLEKMGQSGRERVLAEFSEKKLATALEEEVQRLVADQAHRPRLVPEMVFAFFFVLAIVIPTGFLTTRILMWGVGLEEAKYLREQAEELALNGTKLLANASASVRDEL